MLERLDQVDWRRLSHAYGEATDVPDLLRALTSEEEKVRGEALYDLCGDVCHQGTVYEATAHVVPFVLELIQAPSILDRSHLLAFLRHLAAGSSYLDVHVTSEIERATPEVQSRLHEELGFVADARQAVLEGTDIYLQLLSDKESDVRILAAYLLANLTEKGAEIGAHLFARLETEPDPQVKAALGLGLLELSASPSRQEATEGVQLGRLSDLMVDLMQSGREPPVVRFVAALFLFKTNDKRAVAEVDSVLQQTFDSSRPKLSELPWMQDTDLLPEIHDALWVNPGVRMQHLMRRLEKPNYDTCSEAISEMRDVCDRRPSVAPKTVPFFLKMIESKDVVIRSLAESALRDFESVAELACDGLSRLLNHEDEKVRKTVERTLRSIKSKERSG